MKVPNGVVDSRIFCVTVDRECKGSVQGAISKLDRKAGFDPEGNPVVFWVKTILTLKELENIEGVKFAVHSIR